MFLVPREDATTIDDWFPTGLRATGSRTMAVDDVFVPDHRVQATRDTTHNLTEVRALHPTFDALHAHWPSAARFPFAAVGVGAVWGAVEHFARTAASSTRVANALGGTVRLADQDYVATEFAEAAGEIQMAMQLIEKRSSDASERARQRRTPSEADLALEQRDNALVTRVALRSVQRIYSLVGSKAEHPAHPVSLAKRDMEMVSHHVTLNWRQSAVRYLASFLELFRTDRGPCGTSVALWSAGAVAFFYDHHLGALRSADDGHDHSDDRGRRGRLRRRGEAGRPSRGRHAQRGDRRQRHHR